MIFYLNHVTVVFDFILIKINIFPLKSVALFLDNFFFDKILLKVLTIIFNKASIVCSVLLSKRIGRSGQSAIVDCPEFFFYFFGQKSNKCSQKSSIFLVPFAFLVNWEPPEAVNLNPEK